MSITITTPDGHEVDSEETPGGLAGSGIWTEETLAAFDMGWKAGRISEETAAGLIELFGRHSDMGTAVNWSCREAEMIAGLLRELGADEEDATAFLAAHGEQTDDEGDEHYQEQPSQTPA